MKKRKFSMLINIAIICLCVCSIAIGVYSAKQASLNVNGTIGFTAHNCEVSFEGYLYGFTTLPDDFTQTTKENTTIKKSISQISMLDNWDFSTTNVYFVEDLSQGGTNEVVKDITLEMTFTNLSVFMVNLVLAYTTIPTPPIIATCDNIQVTDVNKTKVKQVVLGAKDTTDASTTITIKYSIKANADGTLSEITPTAKNMGEMTISLEKTTDSNTSFTLNNKPYKIAKGTTWSTFVAENGSSADLAIADTDDHAGCVYYTKAGVYDKYESTFGHLIKDSNNVKVNQTDEIVDGSYNIDTNESYCCVKTYESISGEFINSFWGNWSSVTVKDKVHLDNLTNKNDIANFRETIRDCFDNIKKILKGYLDVDGGIEKMTTESKDQFNKQLSILSKHLDYDGKNGLDIKFKDISLKRNVSMVLQLVIGEIQYSISLNLDWVKN